MSYHLIYHRVARNVSQLSTSSVRNGFGYTQLRSTSISSVNSSTTSQGATLLPSTDKLKKIIYQSTTKYWQVFKSVHFKSHRSTDNCTKCKLYRLVGKIGTRDQQVEETGLETVKPSHFFKV